MVRKSLWIGLQLGIFAGVVFAIVKTVQSRRAAREPIAPPEAWRPPPRAGGTTSEPRVAPTRPVPARPGGPARPSAPPPTPSVVVPRPDDVVIEPPAVTPEPPAVVPEPPAPAAPEPAAAPPPVRPARKAAKKATKAAKKAAAPRGWVEASDGTCPQTHPVKGKLSSKIFHLPGMLAYDRTRADRCYADAAAAEADGLRAAKR